MLKLDTHFWGKQDTLNVYFRERFFQFRNVYFLRIQYWISCRGPNSENVFWRGRFGFVRSFLESTIAEGWICEVTKIDPEKKVLTAHDQGPTRSSSFELSYDKLVIGLPASNDNTLPEERINMIS